jgi:two-component system, response regulator / RNA-binding antiterminator
MGVKMALVGVFIAYIAIKSIAIFGDFRLVCAFFVQCSKLAQCLLHKRHENCLDQSKSITSDPADDYAISQAERSRSLRIGLLENGFNLVAVLPADTFLNERLTQLQPDMIIVDAESQARDALEHVVVATRDARRPIVMFTNDNDTSHVKDAVAAGVSAYIVAGLSSERIRPILDVAMARFQHEQALRQELADTKVELQDRKIIDRAKGMLMQRQGLNEQAAYDKLRKTAMDKSLKVVEVAQRMLDVADLLA